jgi:thiamine kinase-like enzyme
MIRCPEKLPIRCWTKLVEKLLPWLKRVLWEPHEEGAGKIQELCQAFYYDKTLKRVDLFKNKYPDIVEATKVNGNSVRPIQELLSQLPDSLTDGVPVFMHGDLQFDNIITDGEKFTLIDWRQDFAGEVAFGDWYYDLAKMLGGIYLNYDNIKEGLMSFEQKGDEAFIEFTTRKEAPEYAEILRKFVESEGLDFRRVEILRGLIYLNMAPLHHPPFDRLLYALAQETLTKALA